jgi:putative ABC transport system substrate-binding protein
MRRREFITLLGGATAWPLGARAQQATAMKRVGVLLNFAATQPRGQAVLAVFVERLRQLGWSEGQNLRIEVRWNAGDAELAKIFAAQLVELMPDVILAATSTNLTMIRQVTSTVPSRRSETKMLSPQSQLQNCVGAVNYWDLRADF